LVRCINLLEKPTLGNIFFDDINLAKVSSKELRKARQSIGMIFQQFNLLCKELHCKIYVFH
jgi:D-methionine transport system ATP-binding protein